MSINCLLFWLGFALHLVSVVWFILYEHIMCPLFCFFAICFIVLLDFKKTVHYLKSMMFGFHFSTPTQAQNRYSILGWGCYRWPTRYFLNSKGENVICKAMKGVSTNMLTVSLKNFCPFTCLFASCFFLLFAFSCPCTWCCAGDSGRTQWLPCWSWSWSGGKCYVFICL